MSSTRVYVGNLSDRIKSRDLEDIFYKVLIFGLYHVCIIGSTNACNGFHAYSTARYLMFLSKFLTAAPAMALLNLMTNVMRKMPCEGETVS